MWTATATVITSFLFHFCLISLSSATTEWWGDLRAHLNPDRSPAFYDVTYDETAAECPQGLRSDAIPEYVYFGIMVATMTVNEHEECLRKCAEKPRCKAVNYFHPFAYQEKGFCELLSETQHDNPRLMRPFRKATYYENIRCKEEDDVEDTDESISEQPIDVRERKEEMSTLLKKLSTKTTNLNSGFRAA
ncbi:unnamed protein product [Auanema sp. JU1783]|nr:unnamed protein product [Auanema sp. JU1783]